MVLEDRWSTTNESNSSRTFSFDKFSRTLIVGTQMIGDAGILTGLSFVSLFWVISPQHMTYQQAILYVSMTACTTSFVISRFACYGVYDVFSESKWISVTKTTEKCLLKAILLLTAFLFAFKISDGVSRLWLATWSITSGIALCGFRLLTAAAAKRLRETGQLTKNVAIVAASEVGHQLAAKLAREHRGTRLVGIFDERQSRFVKSGVGAPAVRQLPALYELLCRGCVDEVVIAIPPYASRRILELS